MIIQINKTRVDKLSIVINSPSQQTYLITLVLFIRINQVPLEHSILKNNLTLPMFQSKVVLRREVSLSPLEMEQTSSSKISDHPLSKIYKVHLTLFKEGPAKIQIMEPIYFKV